MDNQPLVAKNITISAIETLDWGFKIKDEHGLVYNISQTKKDKTTSRAFLDITALPNNGMGLQKCFKFAEVANKMGGTSRYVRMVSDPEVGATQTPAQSNMGQAKAKVENNDTQDHIRWCNALNNASLLCKKDFTIDNGVETLENFKKTLYELANYIYRLQPDKEQQMNEELNNMEEVPNDDINVSQIPF